MEHFAKVSSYPGKHMFLCYHVKDFPFVVIQVNTVRASCSECTPKLLDVYTILSAERLNLIFFHNTNHCQNKTRVPWFLNQ